MTGILTEVDIIDVARVVEGEDNTGGSVASQDNEWTWEGIKSIGNRYVPTRNVEIPTEPIAMFMSKDIKTVRKQQSIVEVGQMMITNDIEQLPLIEGNNLIGVVRDVNFLEAL
jgi:Predicted transcriptional regulator containing CBS domains